MKKPLRLLALAYVLCCVPVAISQAAAEGMPKITPGGATAEPATDVGKAKGEVLKIDGQSYLIKDASGNQTMLTLDKDTKLEGTPKIGDKIEAEFSPDGRLISLKVSR